MEWWEWPSSVGDGACTWGLLALFDALCTALTGFELPLVFFMLWSLGCSSFGGVGKLSIFVLLFVVVAEA